MEAEQQQQQQRSKTPVTPAGQVGAKSSGLDGPRSVGKRKGATSDINVKVVDNKVHRDHDMRAKNYKIRPPWHGNPQHAIN